MEITTLPLSSVCMSHEIDQLLTALSAFQGEMQTVKKENHGHRHRYANIDTVLQVIRPLLQKYGLSIQQHPDVDMNGNQRLTTILGHVSGQWTASAMKVVYDPEDIQSLGGAITYTRRYAIVSLLGIEQEDDDGNSSHQVAADHSGLTGKQVAQLMELHNEDPQRGKAIQSHYKVNKYKDLTQDQFMEIMGRLAST